MRIAGLGNSSGGEFIAGPRLSVVRDSLKVQWSMGSCWKVPGGQEMDERVLHEGSGIEALAAGAVDVSDADESATAALAQQRFPWFPAERVVAGQDELVELLIDEAVERRSSWSLGDLFPTVPGGTVFSGAGLSVRLGNVLAREDIVTFGDLGGRTLAEVLAFRSLGAKSVDELLRLLCLVALREESRAADGEPESAPARRRRREHRGDEAPVSPEAQLLEDVRLLALWNHWTGASASTLFPTTGDADGDSDRGFPDAIEAARARIAKLTASDFVDPGSISDLASLLDDHIRRLGEREQDLIASRIASRHPETLDTLGNRWGVSRERIRQRESTIKASMLGWLVPDSELGYRAAALRSAISPVAHLDDVIAGIPSLGGTVIDGAVDAWFLLDAIDSGFDSDGSWMASPGIETARASTVLQLEAVASEHQAFSFDDAWEQLAEWSGLAPARLRDWLEFIGCKPIEGGYLIARPSHYSVPDQAAGYLSLAGRRTSAEEILAAVAPDKSLGTLKNGLGSDSRFVRVDRSEWELASWGGAAYSGIKQKIREAIDANDGAVALEELLAEITTSFSVSENSVRTFAAGWPFETQKGIVRLVTGPKAPTKSPSRTRGVFVDDSGVRFRIVVNSEHLRGSGSPLPVGLMTALGFTTGEVRDFSGPTGHIRISWNQGQPLLSSIRSVLLALDAAADDALFLRFDGADGFDAWVAEAPDDSDGATVAALIGARAASVSIEQVATAVGLPAGTHGSSVLEHIEARNEPELLAAVARFLGDEGEATDA